MFFLAWLGLAVGLGVCGFWLGRGFDKSKLKRDLIQQSVDVTDLRAAFEKLLESHKRLRSSERMTELRQARQAGAVQHAESSESSSATEALTLKDQLRIKAGLIPRRVGSIPAQSDAGTTGLPR